MTTTVPARLAISVAGLRKSYGDQVVLNGIDLAVPEGTIFSLLGPNGAGKTTVVQILSTLINADGGELRVARLAAAGRSNREIAQALFITTKTASAHLSRVYRKLDITRREQLAGALAGTRPAPSGPGGLQAG